MNSPFRLKAATSILAGCTALLMLSAAPAQAETTITAVMQAPLRSLDPTITTAYVLRNYGYMIYDTLLNVDENGDVRPQMLEKWETSDDGKTYTFFLREGLQWHDGTPVTAADCMASINRWNKIDKMGQIMDGLTASMDEIDDKTFSITFNVATDIALRALSKAGSQVAFMMPKRVAETSPSEAITESIGSGPFKFDASQFKPGVQAVFLKNEDYRPRAEEPNGLSGGHVVKVDKVKWVAMPDAMTSINALKNHEIDFIEQAPYDLLPLIESDSSLQIIASKPQGGIPVMRLNHLHPPFDNPLARRAALAAIDQAQIMTADIGNPDYYQTCTTVYGCGSLYASDAGAEDLVKADPEKAKKLLEEAGYNGTPVVIMQPTDFANAGGSFVPVIAQNLRNAGFKVDIQAMDWQTVITRRASQKPVADGGWNIFTTYISLTDLADPLSNYTIAANGEGAWFGWPKQDEIESLREKFAVSADAAELKSLAERIQELAYDTVTIVPLGQFAVAGAADKSVGGFLTAPVPVFWNLTKSAN